MTEHCPQVAEFDNNRWELRCFTPGCYWHGTRFSNEAAAAAQDNHKDSRNSPSGWLALFESEPRVLWFVVTALFFLASVGLSLSLFNEWPIAWLNISPGGDAAGGAFLIAAADFIIVAALALCLYRYAVTKGGLTRGGAGSGNILTRLTWGFGGMAITIVVLVVLFGASYFHYGQRPNFVSRSSISCQVPTSLAKPNGAHGSSVSASGARIECTSGAESTTINRRTALYISMSTAATLGSESEPNTGAARWLTASQMVADLYVIVMFAAVILAVVRPDKNDMLTTGNITSVLREGLPELFLSPPELLQLAASAARRELESSSVNEELTEGIVSAVLSVGRPM